MPRALETNRAKSPPPTERQSEREDRHPEREATGPMPEQEKTAVRGEEQQQEQIKECEEQVEMEGRRSKL